jgi:hypothetical protein
MDKALYNSTSWRKLRARARERDANRCTVARLIGGECSGLLHVHHIDRDADPLDLSNVGTVCAAHHPRWEALRRALVEQRQPRWRRCPHRHRSAEAQAICERRLNRVAA